MWLEVLIAALLLLLVILVTLRLRQKESKRRDDMDYGADLVDPPRVGALADVDGHAGVPPPARQAGRAGPAAGRGTPPAPVQPRPAPGPAQGAARPAAPPARSLAKSSTGPSAQASSAPDRGTTLTRAVASAPGTLPGTGSPSNFGIPRGFDTPAFLANAKLYFGRLQQAWGRGDLNALQQFTSPQLYTALTHELRNRRDNSPRTTQVIALEASLLGIENSAHEHIASVHFMGTLSVDGSQDPIDEVWNLTRSARGDGGWVLAGIQQLS